MSYSDLLQLRFGTNFPSRALLSIFYTEEFLANVYNGDQHQNVMNT